MGIPNPINKSGIKTALTSVARGLHNNISPNNTRMLPPLRKMNICRVLAVKIKTGIPEKTHQTSSLQA